MLRYILRRLGLMIVLLFGVSVMVFLISNLVPASPEAANLSQSAQADPEIVAAFREKWGLDKPIWERYAIYMGNLLQGDMGTSIRTGRPVLDELGQYFPATLELSLFAMIIAIVLGVSFGTVSAIFQNRPIDHVLRTLSISGVSVPSFWFALVVMSVFAGNSGRLAAFQKGTFPWFLGALAVVVLLGILCRRWGTSQQAGKGLQRVRSVFNGGAAIVGVWGVLLVISVLCSLGNGLPSSGRFDVRQFGGGEGTGLRVLDSILQGNMPMLGDALIHLILPAFVLGFFTMGLIARQTRSNLLEAMSMDYIRTARAKGMSERRVVVNHALGNALVPVITVSAMGFCNLLGGMVFVEQIFSWPGIGQYAYLAAVNLDFPAICGVSLLIAVIYVVVNLLTDILYGVIDPRIRYQ